jgi:hypothetical protein
MSAKLFGELFLVDPVRSFTRPLKNKAALQWAHHSVDAARGLCRRIQSFFTSSLNDCLGCGICRLTRRRLGSWQCLRRGDERWYFNFWRLFLFVFFRPLFFPFDQVLDQNVVMILFSKERGLCLFILYIYCIYWYTIHSIIC